MFFFNWRDDCGFKIGRKYTRDKGDIYGMGNRRTNPVDDRIKVGHGNGISWRQLRLLDFTVGAS